MRARKPKPATTEEAHRRAGGRRGYNSRRKQLAGIRQAAVARLLCKYGIVRGVGKRIAAELNVSEAAICRDIAAILRQRLVCPACGRPTAA